MTKVKNLIFSFVRSSGGVVITGLLIFRAVAEPRISSKSAKSREIHKNTRNPAKFARNWKVISAVGAAYVL